MVRTAMDYAVGQEIAYVRWHHLSHDPIGGGKAKIAKINRWGHIELNNGKVFDKKGHERNKSYYDRSNLIAVADYDAAVARRDARHARRAAQNRIAEILRKYNSFYDIAMSDDDKCEFKQLIDQL